MKNKNESVIWLLICDTIMTFSHGWGNQIQISSEDSLVLFYTAYLTIIE